jgi:molecular chaperone Hsp33
MSDTTIKDGVLRAMTDDGAFRVVTVRSTDMAKQLISAQKVSGATAERLAELATAAIVVRETMAPDYRLQAVLRSAGDQGRIVVDTHPDGGTRGLVTRKDPGKDVSLQGGTLEIVRTLYSGDVHRGIVEVPDGGGISETLMTYLQVSEQVASMLSLACVLDPSGNVLASGGYLVQLLPEVGRAPLAVMAERLRDFEHVGPLLAQTDAAQGPLLEELLYGMPYTRLGERPVSWQCRCSGVRVMSSLSTLPKSDVADLIAEGRVIELSCDFCGQTYEISPGQLAGLLDQS